jgi:hypothetical protein
MDEQQHMLYSTSFSNVVTERKLIMQEFGQDDSDGPIFDGNLKKSLFVALLI